MDQIAFGEYLAMLEYKLGRRDELDRRIEALAVEPSYKEAVGRLCCLKGISTRAAMVLVTEIGDFRRFEHPGKLMAYVGLVPTEHSSGGSRRRGSITKAGNTRVRHVLVQAAWNYRYPPRHRAVLKRRQQGQPPDAVARSWKAQNRLHKVYKRLAFRKNSKIAAVAVARELAGFVWALMQEDAAEQAGTPPENIDKEHTAS
ncbi:MAG: IS110 family transposase [Gemmatimonadetes bacterium]|nr:IS110 family transposase [Gemmatimonadota bacterium]MYG21107.1 IS110 family transposase [Gemmatimonadota bacterium]MYJ40185.1 IS110 family transposase [Gemmatimonadota bacterium]